MAQVIRPHQPLDITHNPGRLLLRQQLRRCSCGCLSFLDLPCRNCGCKRWKSEFSRAHARGRRQVCVYLGGIVLMTLVAMGVVAIVHPGLALLPSALAVILVVSEWKNGGMSLYDTFFLFHQKRVRGDKKLVTAADTECLLAIQEAYDGDLLRLENMLEKARVAEDYAIKVEQLFLQARQLASIYHNRRLSALMARCLLFMQPEEGIRVDMDEVCRFLYPQDLEDVANDGTLLRWLNNWVKASCLPMGRYTAQALVRICALRIESFAVGMVPAEVCRHIIDTKWCQRSFTKTERIMIQAIWTASGLGGDWSKQGVFPLRQWQQMKKKGMLDRPLQHTVRAHLPAQYWADICLYSREEIPYGDFMDLVKGGTDEHGKQLLEMWGQARQKEAET